MTAYGNDPSLAADNRLITTVTALGPNEIKAVGPQNSDYIPVFHAGQ